MEDLESRDYNLSSFEEDERFIRCRKECIFAEVWGIGLILISLLISYLMSKNPETFHYILGYPAWFVIATLVLIVGAAGTIIFALKFMKKPNLTAIDSGEEQK